jgi:hypothetical protein
LYGLSAVLFDINAFASMASEEDIINAIVSGIDII